MAERDEALPDPSAPGEEQPEEPRPDLDEAILVLADLVALNR